MLAETRKQAFQERKQLERKMRGFNNPINGQVSNNEVGAQSKRNEIMLQCRVRLDQMIL